MTANSLPISRLINVDVDLTQLPSQAQNLSNTLILGTSTVIDVIERMRSYASIDDVADDFGTTAEEYLAALLWFEQAPQPNQVFIGRWAKLASAGQLICAPLSAANSLLSAWTGVVNGGFHISHDGGGSANITGLNFSAAVNLNGVAAIITAGLTGVVCTYDAVNNRFVFTSGTTGAASAVSFLTPPTAGTDISDNLAGRVSDSGAYVANGIVAESALAAATLFEQRFSQRWYALVIPSAVDGDHLAVAPFIEAGTTKHVYGVTTQSAGTLTSVDTTSIAYLLKQLAYKKTIVQYSSTSAYAVMSLLGRILTTNYDGNNTVITLMYKQEPGIVAENLTNSQADALQARNCNVFAAYNNDTAIIQYGVMTSGEYADNILGADWLAVTILTGVYNTLYTSPTKIPQTDAGVHVLVTTIESVCAQGVVNGLLAPGTWNSQGFGQLNQGDLMPKGFYVYAPPMASQSQANRAARKSVPIQVAAKLAGAIHTVDVLVHVNQ